MNIELNPVPAGVSTFVEAPRCERREADVALIGIPYKSPYEVSVPLEAVDTAAVSAADPWT